MGVCILEQFNIHVVYAWALPFQETCGRQRSLREERPAVGLVLQSYRLVLGSDHDFVLPADVCAAPGREGTAGWTWYTGSAGWYLRAALKSFPPLPKSDGL